MKSSGTLAVLIFKGSTKWRPLGLLFQVETMLTGVQRLAFFSPSLKCNTLGSACIIPDLAADLFISSPGIVRIFLAPPPLLFVKFRNSRNICFMARATTKSGKQISTEEDWEKKKEEEERTKKKKKNTEKDVLWAHWCKKLFLLSAAWLTFPADTDKRMGGARRPLCVFARTQLGKRKARGGRNK